MSLKYETRFRTNRLWFSRFASVEPHLLQGLITCCNLVQGLATCCLSLAKSAPEMQGCVNEGVCEIIDPVLPTV